MSTSYVDVIIALNNGERIETSFNVKYTLSRDYDELWQEVKKEDVIKEILDAKEIYCEFNW